MAQYLGRAKVMYDGRVLDTHPGAKIDLGGIERTPVIGDYTDGYAEKRKNATVECELNVGKDTPIQDIRNIAGATVIFEADIGRRWIVRDAFVTDTLTITAGEGGKVPVKISGKPAEEG